MQISHKEIHYTDDASIFELNKKLSNGIQFKSYILFATDSFRDYQKDIIEEVFADFADSASIEHYDIEKIKDIFEQSLESLNTKLKAFAQKMDTVNVFHLKWFVQLVVDNTLMTSMIGDVSVMIFRNQKLYYSLHNTTESDDKIDVFSDFIEWDVESHDEIVYLGTKITDVLDDVDVQELESHFDDPEPDLLWATQALLQSRIDTDKVWFITHYFVKWSSTRVDVSTKSKFKFPKISALSAPGLLKYKKSILANKYYVSVGILSILILFLFYHVLSQMINFTQTDVMFTDEWTLVDVTIDDIKKDIQVFLSMDPTSDAKGQKYHETMQKLNTLEWRWRRLDDVAQLKNIIQKNYYEWFNIIYINDFATFNDASSSAQIISFNNAERNALWDLMYIGFTNNIVVAGTQGVLIWLLNSSVRGSLIDFGLSIPMVGCAKNLLRNGLYCHTSDTIYNITNAWIETVTTTDEEFPTDIDAVDVYGQANMYIFHKNFAVGWTWSDLVTRYRNMMWSQTQYQWWQSNAVITEAVDGISFSDGFSSYTIDGSFMAWSRTDAKLYQFWREWASTMLSARQIPLQWGDKVSSSYGSDTVVHASLNSRYVYLLDKENQTFTVYDSSPVKDGDAFRRDYVLRYLFRFQFDVNEEKIIDFAIPESTGNRPELYFLTTDGVYKIALHEFISSLASGTLKQVWN